MSFLEIPMLNTQQFIRPGSRICLVSDFRYEADIEHGRPFSEAEMGVLIQALGSIGISIGACSILHTITEPCTQVSISRFWTPKGGFTTQGMEQVMELRKTINEMPEPPNVLILLGEIPIQALTELKSVTKIRGSIIPANKLSPAIKCIPTISPKVALRQYLYRYYIQSDCKKALEQSDFPDIEYPKRDLLVSPTFQEVMDFLKLAKQAPQLSVDIETARNEVSCIGIATTPYHCMSIPFYDYWTEDEELEIWLQLDDILGDPNIEKVFQNGMFDMYFLLVRNRIITRGYIHDTMIKHHINYPDFPKGLAFLTSIYTNEPYYKDDGKQWFQDIKAGTNGDINQFFVYNAKDAAVTMEVNDLVSAELVKYGNKDTYELSRRLINPLLYMQMRGIRVDLESLSSCKDEANKSLIEAQKKLDEIVGYPLNVNSPKACIHYFYHVKGYAPITKKTKDPKTGERKISITADDKAMKRLIKKYNSEEARLVQTIRSLRKMISTYFELTLDKDNRLRCSYNIAGTNTGRLSSSETCFGTGQNLQNLPKAFRIFLCADEGYICGEIDLSQAEWVATAYICGDANMIKAVEERLDAHIHTANLMFGIPKELIKEENDVIGSDTDEDSILEKRKERFPDIFQYHPISDMSVRQAGKKCLAEGTEVLTNRGWVAIEYLEPFDLVAQWEAGLITFVQPSEYFEYDHDDVLYEISANHVHQLVTPEHKLIIARDNDRPGNKYQEVSASNLDTNLLHYHIPTSGKIKCPGKSAIAFTPDEIRLLVAVQADGCITKYGDIVFKFWKDRKTQQLKNILNKLDLRYTEKPNYFFIFKSNPLVKKIAYFLGDDKNFGSYLLSSSYEALDAFIDEIPNWDGYAPKKQYFSTNKNNAEWVQTIAHLTLRRATIKETDPKGFGKKPLYWVGIGKATGTSLISLTKDTIDYCGNVFCITVPAGFFMIRSNGKISITGNSNHSFNYGLSPNGFALQYNTELKNAKRCYNLYHNSYPNIRIWHQHVRYQLGKTRTLENLFGRKRRFLDRWNEDLFKAAYSYNPQSSIAQLLNMALIDVYEQQDRHEFLRPLELLNQVHDSVWFQYPISQIKMLPAALMFIQDSLQRPLTCHGRDFFIRCDCKIGLNFKQLKEIDINSISIDDDIRLLIENLNETSRPSVIELSESDNDDEMEEVPGEEL